MPGVLHIPLACLIGIILGNFSNCNNGDEGEIIDSKELKQPLIELNKSQTQIESEMIDAFVSRHQWRVTETGTGLRYFIYKESENESENAKEGQVAVVDFVISLLDGTICYSSKDTGPQEFLIGQDNVESGLHEGITFMKTGDKAKLILPSHLAHGLIGDQDKIPPRATIIYDIELLELK